MSEELKPERVLLLTSYCDDDEGWCTDDMPCLDCLKMCNVADAFISIRKVHSGWDFMRAAPANTEQPITAQEAMEAWHILSEDAHEYACGGLSEEQAQEEWASATVRRYIEQTSVASEFRYMDGIEHGKRLVQEQTAHLEAKYQCAMEGTDYYEGYEEGLKAAAQEAKGRNYQYDSE